jgi:hypothetical protein
MNGMSCIKIAILTLALLCGHHHGRPVHAPGTVAVTYDYAANPCAPGHPPVSPDAGDCQGARFIAS